MSFPEDEEETFTETNTSEKPKIEDLEKQLLDALDQLAGNY